MNTKIRHPQLFVLGIIEIILYLFTPIQYSYSYCITWLFLFIISAIILYKNNIRNNLICFEAFFTLSFFFANYVYPIIYYPINPYFSLFTLNFNEDYINQGIAISTIGYTFFVLGTIRNTNVIHIQRPIPKLKQPIFLIYLLFLLFIPQLLAIHSLGTYSTSFESNFSNLILQYLLYYFIFASFYNHPSGIINVFNSNKIVWCLIGVYVLLFLLIGSRTLPLRIILITIFCYNVYIKRIKRKYVILGILGGAMLFTFIGIFREGINTLNLTSIFDLGQDLTINNRSQYVLLEYTDKHGLTYGKTMLMNILSAVPFLQSIFLGISGWQLGDISSGYLVTDLYFKGTNEEVIGLGTNLIGDIYVSFGLLGVILFMYVGGRLLRYVSLNYLNGYPLFILIYALLFMDSIYIVRSSFFTWIRPVVWCWIIYLFINRKSTQSFGINQKVVSA